VRPRASQRAGGRVGRRQRAEALLGSRAEHHSVQSEEQCCKNDSGDQQSLLHEPILCEWAIGISTGCTPLRGCLHVDRTYASAPVTTDARRSTYRATRLREPGRTNSASGRLSKPYECQHTTIRRYRTQRSPLRVRPAPFRKSLQIRHVPYAGTRIDFDGAFGLKSCSSSWPGWTTP
jgi:hypothetical protein